MITTNNTPAWAGMSDTDLVTFFEVNEAIASRIPALVKAAEAAHDRLAAREERIARDAGEAKRLIAAYKAHLAVGNCGGMGAAVRGLQDAFMQAGLIRHLGGLEVRDDFLKKATEEMELLRRAKMAAKKPHRSKWTEK